MAYLTRSEPTFLAHIATTASAIGASDDFSCDEFQCEGDVRFDGKLRAFRQQSLADFRPASDIGPSGKCGSKCWNIARRDDFALDTVFDDFRKAINEALAG